MPDIQTQRLLPRPLREVDDEELRSALQTRQEKPTSLAQEEAQKRQGKHTQASLEQDEEEAQKRQGRQTPPQGFLYQVSGLQTQRLLPWPIREMDEAKMRCSMQRQRRQAKRKEIGQKASGCKEAMGQAEQESCGKASEQGRETPPQGILYQVPGLQTQRLLPWPIREVDEEELRCLLQNRQKKHTSTSLEQDQEEAQERKGKHTQAPLE